MKKIIHYCWFGGGALPPSIRLCKKSWEKFFPGYEIKEWNENNFNVKIIPYTQEAYAAKKYAFVSDYARFWILYNYGGLYFDTDVEIIRDMSDIVRRGPFMGCEREAEEGQPAKNLCVAPGLGLGAELGMPIYKEILNLYEMLHFVRPDGSLNYKTVVEYVTEILCAHGLKNLPQIQQCADIWIYPKEYFSPKDVDTRELQITPNSVSIHHYDSSWAEWYDKSAGIRGPRLKRVFGTGLGNIINVWVYVLEKYGTKLFRSIRFTYRK